MGQEQQTGPLGQNGASAPERLKEGLLRFEAGMRQVFARARIRAEERRKEKEKNSETGIGAPGVPALARSAQMTEERFQARLAQPGLLPERGAVWMCDQTVPIEEMSNLFGIGYEEGQEMFVSGRVGAFLAELLCAKRFGFTLHRHNDVPGSDGWFIDEAAELRFISVKGLGKSAWFKPQPSVLTGSGREGVCDIQALRESILPLDWFCVAQMEERGRIWMALFPAQCILDWISAGLLGPSGLGAKRFWEALNVSCQEQKTLVFSLEEKAQFMNKLREENQKAALLAKESSAVEPVGTPWDQAAIRLEEAKSLREEKTIRVSAKKRKEPNPNQGILALEVLAPEAVQLR